MFKFFKNNLYIAFAVTTTKIINKAFKFRIYPNAEQREMLAKHFGHCRFVYNHFLAERIAFYKAHKDAPKGSKRGLSYKDNSKGLTQLKKSPDAVWLRAVNSQSFAGFAQKPGHGISKIFQSG